MYLFTIALMGFKHVLGLKGKLCILQNNCPNAPFDGATVKWHKCAPCLGQNGVEEKRQLNSTSYKPCISTAKFTDSIINFLETSLKIGSHQVIKYGNFF